MKVEQQQHGNVLVLVPHGPLVREDSADFGAAVQAGAREQGGRVVLDMTNVPYLDSAGIECLLAQCGSGDRVGSGRPRLACLTETCREALDLTDVLPRVEVFDTVENAMRSLRR